MAEASAAERARRRPSRATALVALWVVVMAGVALAAGCYGRNCEGEITVFGRNPGEGRLLSDDMWESTPVDGNWLPFPQQRLWIFEIPDLSDRYLADIRVSISAQQNQIVENGNFTTGAGNIAEVSGVGRGRFAVRNGTCANYYVRVVVLAAPTAPEPPVADAGADASGDAPGDAEAGP